MNVDSKALMMIEKLLHYPADMDHYCEEPECTLETPHCAEMHTKRALVEVRKLLEPVHVSMQPNRLGNDPERIYATQWLKENERVPGSNHGYTALEWIMIPEGEDYPDRVTQRDAHVAASVVQWLGTSIGFCFIRRCEEQIDKARAVRGSWGPFVYRNVEPPTGDLATATLLAGPFCNCNHKMHQDLILGIVAALQKAREEVAGGTYASLIGGKLDVTV